MSKLLETLLHSEFKFGFELEAYMGKNVIDDYLEHDDDEYFSDEYYDEDTFDGYGDQQQFGLPHVNFSNLESDLMDYFAEYFGNNIEIDFDSSLDDLRGGFEFPTPVMTFTPLNIQKSIKFLYEIMNGKYEIYTDKSCGFHVHLSFPNMSAEDMAWIICNIAINDDIRKHFEKFKDSYNIDYDFITKYSSNDYLNDIKNSFLKNDWKTLSENLSSQKFRLIRLHPQKTLEWRGPRNFLNKNNLQIIKDFFKHLYIIVSDISTIMDSKYISNISRDNFFKLVSLENVEENINKVFNDSIYDSIYRNPLILTKLNNRRVNWQYFVKRLQLFIENEKDTPFDSFIIPLRYKKFNNKKILNNIIKLCPEFAKYSYQN